MSVAENMAPPPRLCPQRPYLERLVVNVSHDCNLRCKYCYADSGTYGSERMNLSEAVGRRIVDDFLARFREIGTVQFFGGEPLLNYRGIESVCEYLTAVCRRDGVRLPGFTVITNGTVLSGEIVDLINRYKIAVTVSLDGDRQINDAQRVSASGKGSYAKIVANIRALKERTGQPMQIEGTYTAKHLDAGFSFAQFMPFLAKELDVHFLHMPWIVGKGYNGTAIAPTEENVARIIAVYSEAIAISLQSLTTPDLRDTILISAVDRALRRQFFGNNGERTHVCPAGSGTLAVGADGRIFPCFMFTNHAQFELDRVGNLQDEVFDSRRAAFVDRLLVGEDANRGSLETGSACAGQNFELEGGIDRIGEANRHIQNSLDLILHDRIAAFRADANLWEWAQTKMLLHQLQTLTADAC